MSEQLVMLAQQWTALWVVPVAAAMVAAGFLMDRASRRAADLALGLGSETIAITRRRRAVPADRHAGDRTIEHEQFSTAA